MHAAELCICMSSVGGDITFAADACTCMHNLNLNIHVVHVSQGTETKSLSGAYYVSSVLCILSVVKNV